MLFNILLLKFYQYIHETKRKIKLTMYNIMICQKIIDKKLKIVKHLLQRYGMGL